MISSARKRANDKYIKSKYGQICYVAKRERISEIKEHAQNRGETVNGFLTRAINNQMATDTETGTDTGTGENLPSEKS